MFVFRRCITIATLLITLPVAAQQRSDLGAIRRSADSIVRAYLAAGHAPSAGVAVIRGNDTLLLAGYGIADLEHEVAATAQSVYRIGSVTKQFTAAAVLQLVEQGRLALDDSIAAHLGNLPVAWRAVTIRQLLNHTSGIPSYTSLGLRWIRRWGEEMPPDTMFAMVADRRMDFAPGSAWNYNNTGYILLGVLIERLTGKSWGDEIRSRFAEPLGLASVMNCLTTPLIPHRVRGYDKEADRWENTSYLAMSQPFSAGALCATAGDIAKWNQALHGGRVVSAASYAAMTTPAGAAARSAPLYGFALIADTLAGRPIITHGGGIHGFNAANIWVPDVKLSVTVLVNSTSGNATALAQELVRVAVGR